MWVAFSLQWSMFISIAANVEKFMVVPMLGAMMLAGAGERRGWRWAAAGAAAGVAVLYKPICVPVLGVWFLLAAFAGKRQETTGGMPSEPPGAAGSRTPKGSIFQKCTQVWKRAGWVVLGGVVAVVAGVAWFAWKGAMGAMWECAAEYTGEYAKLTGHPWRTGVEFLAYADHWKAWVMLGLAAAGFCGRERAGWKWGALLAVAWGVAMSDANGHYYLMALPIAAMGAGAGIERVAARCGRWGGWLGAAGVAAVFGAMLTGNEGVALRLGPEQLAARLYYGNPFVEAEGAGKIVAALCPEDGTVHVVGSEPEILWHARRKGATRFDIAYPMTLPTGHAAGYQAEALEALRKNAPDAIVFVRTWLGFLGPPEVCAGYLRAMAEMTLGGGYRLEWSCLPAGGGWVEGGEWAEREREGAIMGIWRRKTPDGGGGTREQKSDASGGRECQ